MDDWLFRSAAEQGRAIEAGELDPIALTDAHLAAIEAHPEHARIYARTTADRARAEAYMAAQRAREGIRHGPLDGVPISWKDLYDVADVACEGGTKLLEGRVPEADCPVVTRATKAGTICLGKTHTTECAFSGLGVNPMTATPPNGVEAARAPGGSSSGAAASTKLGLAALGIGSDTGGSVRIPAAWNDLVGLKTTAGLIPTEGVIALSRIYDTVGPLTRTVEDAALMHGILAGTKTPVWDTGTLADETLHVARTVVMDGADDGIGAAIEAALAKLSAAGATVTHGDTPEFQATFDTLDAISPVVNVDAWGEWGTRIEAHPGVMWPPIERRFRQGEGQDPALVPKALAELERHSASLQQRMAENGLIVMPTSPILPPLTEDLMDNQDYFWDRNLLALRNTRLGNLLTLSSITIPSGTPMVGLMLFAPPHAEERLLSIGRAIEKVLAP